MIMQTAPKAKSIVEWSSTSAPTLLFISRPFMCSNTDITTVNYSVAQNLFYVFPHFGLFSRIDKMQVQFDDFSTCFIQSAELQEGFERPLFTCKLNFCSTMHASFSSQVVYVFLLFS